ncbi:MAG TPA: hypothetical protein VNV60_12180, partial [Holophagaceae bacterium]|nr:hypothetical protein [Holophagaceae bacterium]
MKPTRRMPRHLSLGSLSALLATGLWAGGAVPADAPAAGSGSGARVAPAVPYSGRSEDEVLLVELRLRYQTLSQSFPVYPIADGTFIPLG